MAKSSFSCLTYFAFVEVALQNPKIFLNLRCLVSVVDVIEVLKAEQVLFETVVDSFCEGFFHVLSVANAVIHKMELPLEYEKIV